jgi:hypothetical protein
MLIEHQNLRSSRWAKRGTARAYYLAGDTKMKIFQRYNPLQVAKYVKILFRGRLYIKDVGAFEFDKARSLSRK